MANDNKAPTGPDLTKGVTLDQLPDGKTLVGHVGDEDVLLVRQGDDIFAVGSECTHYHGPLAEGLVADGTVRCPWHHACFDLRTGEAVRAPAFDPIACWKVERQGNSVTVRDKKDTKPTKIARGKPPTQIVIVGGGAAGFAAAEMLRREGYSGTIAMLSDDDAAPVDRPNLSKDYLAGSAPEDWVPLRPESFYGEQHIDLRLKTAVMAIDAKAREVRLADGKAVPYDRLLLATGAEPVRLSIPGADGPNVHLLRSFRDSRAIAAAAEGAKRAVVIGSSFIGLEVAASLRARDIEVHVVGPEKRPLEKVLGPQLGDFVRKLHEEHGVIFHLENTPEAIEKGRVVTKHGDPLPADLVVMGVGVKPRLALAEAAGLTIDRGVAVNETLETSAPGIFAAGDIARWPDRHSGQKIRVEHWVVAERQGQVAALNMLGAGHRYDDVPFFWSQHYDVPINYVGHAEGFDDIAVDGDIAGKDCVVRYRKGGKTLAVASIYRDVDSLKAELAMERGKEP